MTASRILNAPPKVSPLARSWLIIATLVLAASGIFSLIIVFARTPGLYELPYVKKLFAEALVVHVDLLVLGWPLCIAAMLWCIFCPTTLSACSHHGINKIAGAMVAIGAICLAFAPLDMTANAVKNNYVPMITSPVFEFGLACFAAASALLALIALFFNKRHNMHDASLMAVCNWGGRGAAIIVLFSLVAIYMGFAGTSLDGIDIRQYYESAYWAGGHMLQFAFTQLQMLAWLWIFHQLTKVELASYTVVRAIFLLNAVIGCAGIYGIINFDTLSFEYNQFYTMHMIIGGGIAPSLFLIYLVGSYIKHKMRIQPLSAHLRYALFASVGLFLYGGLLGLLIQGQDVTIPAHYHGATISVTIALMGFAYAYMPNLTTNPLPVRLMKWQPIIYAAGQFMHITGLAVSGGYGVLRKTPGGMEDGFSKAKMAMGFMGMGGLLAVVGGLMFIFIMWRCLRRS